MTTPYAGLRPWASGPIGDTGPVTSAPEREPAAAGPDGADGLTVGRAAALVGVSVKTLHHWDAIGLVCPSERTWAGYRVYSGDDVARIHRVLVYRELGFPLAEIGRILDDPRFAAHNDAMEPGLAGWLRDTIWANAEAHGVDPESATWR